VFAIVPNSDVRQQLLEVGVGRRTHRFLGLAAGLAMGALPLAFGSAHPRGFCDLMIIQPGSHRRRWNGDAAHPLK
jgi:hypothetical protein